MTAFVWRDGERTIRFGEGASAHAWPGVDLLTTARAEPEIPAAVLETRVHHVAAGQVPAAAAALIDRVGAGAWWRGRGPGNRHREGAGGGPRRRGVRGADDALGR